jgi:hypothetical protein
MIRKVLPVLIALVLIVPMIACEPPTDEQIATVIRSATNVAITQLLEKNPELEDTLYVYALLNKEIILDRTINADLAKKMMGDILMQCKDMDDDDQQLILMLFNTILPLINLPEQGALDDQKEMFLLAFLNGIIDVVENIKALRGPPPAPPVEWEVNQVWFLKEVLNGIPNHVS